MREPVTLMESGKDIVVKLAEGNPGAITVLVQLLKRDGDMALMTLLDLDDMNMRGPQIWVGYKDHCDEDIEKFAQCVSDRDADMVATVNEQCYRPDIEYDGYGEKAVVSDASFQRVGERL